MANEPIKSDEMIMGMDLSKGDDWTYKVNIECSEALKGLKAVTREAKKATQALKEFEDVQKRVKVNG